MHACLHIQTQAHTHILILFLSEYKPILCSIQWMLTVGSEAELEDQGIPGQSGLHNKTLS